MKQKSNGLNKYLIVFLLIQLLILTGCYSGYEIHNPYNQVDWKKDKQYKANLHTHTTRSDGSATPQKVVDSYLKLGYNILAITDHNEMTYPWTEFEKLEVTEQSKDRLATGKIKQEDLVFENRNPSALGMIAVQGSEVSSPHHLGSYFTGYHQRADNETTVIKSIGEEDGLIIFNHPGKYTFPASWYCDFFQKHTHIVGIEVFNQGNRYPNDLAFWDSILVRLMPERLVWGFSNDDMHSIKKAGFNWNLFILPECSQYWVRKGMEEGRFFFVYAPADHNGTNPPQVKSVKVKNIRGVIEIKSVGHDSVRWVSDGKVIHSGNKLRLKNELNFEKYVRAEILGPAGIVIGTQPFGLKSINRNSEK